MIWTLTIEVSLKLDRLTSMFQPSVVRKMMDWYTVVLRNNTTEDEDGMIWNVIYKMQICNDTKTGWNMTKKVATERKWRELGIALKL